MVLVDLIKSFDPISSVRTLHISSWHWIPTNSSTNDCIFPWRYVGHNPVLWFYIALPWDQTQIIITFCPGKEFFLHLLCCVFVICLLEDSCWCLLYQSTYGCLFNLAHLMKYPSSGLPLSRVVSRQMSEQRWLAICRLSRHLHKYVELLWLVLHRLCSYTGWHRSSWHYDEHQHAAFVGCRDLTSAQVYNDVGNLCG